MVRLQVAPEDFQKMLPERRSSFGFGRLPGPSASDLDSALIGAFLQSARTSSTETSIVQPSLYKNVNNFYE